MVRRKHKFDEDDNEPHFEYAEFDRRHVHREKLYRQMDAYIGHEIQFEESTS